MSEIKIDWVQTARANAVEMDKGRMECMPEEPALLRGLADEIERLQRAVRDLSQAAIDAYTTLEPAGKAGLFDDVWDTHRDTIDACREPSVSDRSGEADANAD